MFSNSYFTEKDVMKKKYIVRLSIDERNHLETIIKKLKGSSGKIKRAQILIKADVEGPGWTDKKISEAFNCRIKTVENVRERLVTKGFELTLNGKVPLEPPRAKLLSGEQEAELIAMRLGTPPVGYGQWTLKLLQKQIVELEIVNSISHETVRKTLKKMA